MSQYLHAMRNTFNFSGRASRKQFWLFMFIAIILAIVAITLDIALDLADGEALVFTGLWSLIHIIPSLSVSIRRLHDTDRSGWWSLIAFTGIGQIVLLVFYCLESTQGVNRFGANPHGGDNASHGLVSASQAAQGVVSATNAPNHTQMPEQATGDTLAQIEKLTALRKQGAIDDDEFKRLKADVLSKA
jgi:uncharacterized membrane protein YhaH (DUF805 family)